MRTVTFWMLTGIGGLALLLALRVWLTSEGRELSHWMMWQGFFASTVVISSVFAGLVGWRPEVRRVLLALYVPALVLSLLGGGTWGVVGYVMSQEKLSFTQALDTSLPLLVGSYLLALLIALVALILAWRYRPPVLSASPSLSVRADAPDNPYSPPSSALLPDRPKQASHPLGKAYLTALAVYTGLVLLIVLVLHQGQLSDPRGTLLLGFMLLPVLTGSTLLWGGPALQRWVLMLGTVSIGLLMVYAFQRSLAGDTVPGPVLFFLVLISGLQAWSYVRHRALIAAAESVSATPIRDEA